MLRSCFSCFGRTTCTMTVAFSVSRKPQIQYRITAIYPRDENELAAHGAQHFQPELSPEFLVRQQSRVKKHLPPFHINGDVHCGPGESVNVGTCHADTTVCAHTLPFPHSGLLKHALLVNRCASMCHLQCMQACSDPCSCVITQIRRLLVIAWRGNLCGATAGNNATCNYQSIHGCPSLGRLHANVLLKASDGWRHFCIDCWSSRCGRRSDARIVTSRQALPRHPTLLNCSTVFTWMT